MRTGGYVDKFKAMGYFCDIAETGSFSAAARLAKVPVSSLSRSIQALESELGAELLKRSTRHVTLTEIGRIYLARCREILTAVNGAESQVTWYQSRPSGVLRISALPMYADLKLMPVLESLQEAYPDIILDLDLSSQVTDLNRDGVDIAIRGGGLPDERVIAHYIDSNKHRLCASPSYLQQHGTPQSVQDLPNHKAILYRAPARVLHWGTVIDGDWQPIEIQTALISNGGNILRQALLAGKGLCLMPRWCMLDELADGRVVEVPLEVELATTADPTLGIYMLYQRPHYMIPKVRVAVDFLRQHLVPGEQSLSAKPV